MRYILSELKWIGLLFNAAHGSFTSIYFFFRSRLRSEIRELIGVRDLARFRMVDMFTGCITVAVKETILKSCSQPGGILRVVIANMTFGMGLDYLMCTK